MYSACNDEKGMSASKMNDSGSGGGSRRDAMQVNIKVVVGPNKGPVINYEEGVGL